MLMYCRYCGKELPQNSHSCPNCGNGDELNIATLDISESQNSDLKFTKPKVSFVRNELGGILLVIVILISLFLTHKILTYFFADYYNISNYTEYSDGDYDDFASENYKRKHYYYTYYPSECFYAVDIGNKYSEGDESTSVFKYSSDAKLVSRYSKSGYHNDNNGRNHYYYCSISIFDISEMMKEYSGNDDNRYNAILEKLNLALKTNSYNSQYTTIDGRKAILFYTNDEKSTKRLITCANKRMYFLATSSEYNLESLFTSYCSQFRFSFHPERELFCFFFSFILLFLVILFYNLYLCKRESTKNRYAYSLFIISIISFLINLAIASYQAYGLYSDLDASNMSVYVITGALLTAICVAMPLCVFYIKKSKQNWTKDFKVPQFLRNIHYNRLETDIKKSTYASLVCYPLMVLSLLPFGVYITIIYCFPLLLVCSIIVSYQKWHDWVKDSKN